MNQQDLTSSVSGELNDQSQTVQPNLEGRLIIDVIIVSIVRRLTVNWGVSGGLLIFNLHFYPLID